MKQDSYAVIGKAPKATGICLDELDGTVKAFSASVADVVHAVIEQPLRMVTQHAHHFFDWFETTSHRALSPSIEIPLGRRLGVIGPEMREVLLECPSATGLQAVSYTHLTLPTT